MLIWVSYSVNNHHGVSVVLQEASLKMRSNLLWMDLLSGAQL